MNKRKHTKLMHEDKYVAEVDVELIDTGEGWSPYSLSRMHKNFMTCVLLFEEVISDWPIDLPVSTLLHQWQFD